MSKINGQPGEPLGESLATRMEKQELVHVRARALALLCGRPIEQLTMEDYLQARQEAAESDPETGPKSPGLTVAQSEHWTLEEGGGGRQEPETEQEEEEAEGRSLAEQDAVRGQNKAYSERMHAAALAAHEENQS